MIEKGDVSPETPEEFEVIASTRSRTVECLGELLEVRPLTIGQLPAFAKAVRPMLDVLNDVQISEGLSLDAVVRLIESHGGQLVTAVAAATDRSATSLNGMPLDEFTELITAVFAVNLDFFVQRLLPGSARSINELVEHLRTLRGSGRTPSNSSSTPATH